MTTPKTPPSPAIDPYGAAFAAFAGEFVAESDRAAVILGAAKIDQLLCSLLDRYLLPHPGTDDDLLEGDAPLSTFSARIRMCHRLGLIDPQFAKLLHVFRRLRNAFAHDVSHSSLADGAARDRVLAMVEPFLAAPFYRGVVEKVSGDTNRNSHDPGVMFRAVLVIFYLHLHTTRDWIEPAKPVERDGIVDAARNAKGTHPKEGG